MPPLCSAAADDSLSVTRSIQSYHEYSRTHAAKHSSDGETLTLTRLPHPSKAPSLPLSTPTREFKNRRTHQHDAVASGCTDRDHRNDNHDIHHISPCGLHHRVLRLSSSVAAFLSTSRCMVLLLRPRAVCLRLTTPDNILVKPRQSRYHRELPLGYE